MYIVSYAHEYYQYIPARTTLTYFASITIIFSITMVGTQCMCIKNFGKGLKAYVAGDRRAQELTDQYEEGRQVDRDGTYGFQMTAVEDTTPAPRSMTINDS